MKLLDFSLVEKNIDAVAKYDFDNKKVFGEAYYVYQNGNELKKFYGTRSLDGKELNGKTLFRLASMTKPIVAVAAIIAIDKGLFSLDDELSKYIPELADVAITDFDGKFLAYPETKPTVRHVLSHSSGIGSFGKNFDPEEKDVQNYDTLISFWTKAGLDFEPNSRQQYSGRAAFDFVAKIIEITSGMDLETFIQKELCEPLGMTDTTFLPTDEQRERIVKMHTRVDDRNDEFEMEEGCLFENYPETHMAGAAGLASTLDDYVKFAMMLLNGGKVGDKQIISEESYKELSSPQHPYNFTHHEGWGLGVRIIKEENYPYLLPVGTFGWSGAYGTHFFVDPGNKIVAVMMKNSKIDGGAANETANNMEKAIYTSFK